MNQGHLSTERSRVLIHLWRCFFNRIFSSSIVPLLKAYTLRDILAYGGQNKLGQKGIELGSFEQPLLPLDERVEQHGQAVAELWQNVEGHVLAWNVQAFLDHLQLPDLLPIQPDDLGKIFAPKRW